MEETNKYLQINEEIFLVMNFFITLQRRRGERENGYRLVINFYGDYSCLVDSIKSYTGLGITAIKTVLGILRRMGFIEYVDSKRIGKYCRINIRRLKAFAQKCFKGIGYTLLNTPIHDNIVKYMSACSSDNFQSIHWFIYLWFAGMDKYLKTKSIIEYGGFYMSTNRIVNELHRQGFSWVTVGKIKVFFQKMKLFTKKEFYRERIGAECTKRRTKINEKYPVLKLRYISGKKAITNIPSKKKMLKLFCERTKGGDSRKGQIALQKSKGVTCEENKAVNEVIRLRKTMKLSAKLRFKNSSEYYWKVLGAPSYRLIKRKKQLFDNRIWLKSRYEDILEERYEEKLENYERARKFFGLDRCKIKLKMYDYHSGTYKTYLAFRDENGIMKETFPDARHIGRRHYTQTDGGTRLVRKVFKQVCGGFVVDKTEYISRAVINDFKSFYYNMYGKKRNKQTYNFDEEYIA